MNPTNSQWPEATFRKPDYVFNVWADGNVRQELFRAPYASTLQATNKAMPWMVPITHRILVRMNSAKPQSPVIPEGFIRWHGGECPVAWGVRGSVVHRDGDVRDGKQLRSLPCWPHRGGVADIIAYKPERSPDFKVEVGKFYITASGERIGPLHGGPTIFCVVKDGYPTWYDNGKVYLPHNDPNDLLCLAADQSPMGDA